MYNFAVWSSEAGGFVGSSGGMSYAEALTEIEELVAQGEDEDDLEIMEFCFEHPEQPSQDCEDCYEAEEEGE